MSFTCEGSSVTYRSVKTQVLAVLYGLQSRVAYPQLTSNAEIHVTLSSLLYLVMIYCQLPGFTFIDIKHVICSYCFNKATAT